MAPEAPNRILNPKGSWGEWAPSQPSFFKKAGSLSRVASFPPPPLLTLPSFFKKAVAKQPSLASIAKERCKGGGKKLCLRRQGESPP